MSKKLSELKWHSSTSLSWRKRRRSFLSNVKFPPPTTDWRTKFLLMATFNLAFILKVIPIGQARLLVWFVGDIEHPMENVSINYFKARQKSCIWHF